MRNLKINQKRHIGLNFVGEIEYRDAQGNLTGEKILSYGDEIEFKSHISGASGTVVVDNNGVVIEYDKSFLITRAELEKLGFDENTVFFIDKEPEYDSNGQPLYDYKVKRIKDTLNEVMILLEKVRNR
jgi:hypothetical protein